MGPDIAVGFVTRNGCDFEFSFPQGTSPYPTLGKGKSSTQKCLWRVVFKDLLLLSTLTWGNEPPTSKTKHPSREVAYPIPNVLAKKRKTEQHLRRTS